MALVGTQERMDLNAPLWDLSTFIGRFKYFAWMSDFRTVVEGEKTLHEAKDLLDKYRIGQEPKGTTREQLIYARKLFESSFHPDSGELQNVFGRMSFQVPGGMLITGAMLQWYRTIPAVVFWQWVNQSFNALVNYTNRNAKSSISTTQMGVAYVSATTSALITAIGCKTYWTKHASPFIQRYVPFAAVAAANCVNIPLMRQSEILNGIEVADKDGNIIGNSRVAAFKGISQVVISRIVMCSPGMVLLPVVMEKLEKVKWFKSMPVLHAPFQVMAVGCFLVVMVPAACSLFPQKCRLSTRTMAWLEPEEYEKMKKITNGNVPQCVYFNKGL